MECNKIMAASNLEDIMTRLNGCRALLHLLCEHMASNAVSGDAMNGVCDLLEVICRDFEADVVAAENYRGE